MNAPPKIHMNPEEFLAWGEAQSDGRYELVRGEVVMMAPEPARHNLVKLAIARALQDTASAAHVNGVVFTDGIGVRTGLETIREPDASFQLGNDVDLDATIVNSPLIVVEVVSPSSVNTDENEKLAEYFSVPSIMHYLVVWPKQKTCYHHKRIGDDKVLTTIVRQGTIEFDPPGLTIAMNDIFNEVDR